VVVCWARTYCRVDRESELILPPSGALAQVQQVSQLVGVHRADGADALRVDVNVGFHEEPVHDDLTAAVEEVAQGRFPAARVQ
jgi:hypothetical protein